MLQKKVLIYSGYGTSEFCLKQLVKFFKNNDYELITAKDIISGVLTKDPEEKILCFGGGFDLGYLDSLGSVGCENIKKFVHFGGNYLGICAGAYFACDFIEFDLNGALEVKGPRLGLFSGKAVGPINKKFKYNNDDYCHAIKIQFEMTENYCYLNGGPFFEAVNNQGFESIANYCQSKIDDLLDCDGKIAILKSFYGLGKCVLSGVHFEFDPEDLDSNNENVKCNVQPKILANINQNYDFILNIFE